MIKARPPRIHIRDQTVGDSFDFSVSVTSGGAAADLTGYTPECVIKPRYSDIIRITPTIASNVVTVSVSEANSLLLDKVNDVQVRINNGTNRRTISAGKILTRPVIT